MRELAMAALLVVGCLFFLAGTIGMLRFPDTPTRLHALTKADTLGLGFVAFGVAVGAGSIAVALKLLLVWLLVMGASSTVAYLIAGRARPEAERAA